MSSGHERGALGELDCRSCRGAHIDLVELDVLGPHAVAAGHDNSGNNSHARNGAKRNRSLGGHSCIGDTSR